MSTERQYEYRICYKQKGSVNTSYHYYSALNAEQTKNKGWDIEILAIEEKNPYSLKWEDRSEALVSE